MSGLRSGFGLRAFKKIKEEGRKENKRQYIPNIVCGDSAYAVLTYLKLLAEVGEDKVKLISSHPVDKQDIVSQWSCSLHGVRHEQAAKALQAASARLEVIPGPDKLVFYKDGKFHEIDGRAKPHEFLEDEEHFKNLYFTLKKENLFSTEEWNDLDELLRKGQVNKFISSIERVKPEDLVEVVNFTLYTGENEKLDCERLYWCESPKRFYRLLANKNEVSDGVTGFCAGVEERVGLVVQFEVEGQIYEDAGTVLLPQSATHEWGYFILDFDAFDPAAGKQVFKSMMFIDLDEINEEEVAKRIRLMKRVIGRVFPEFEKIKYTERYHYNEQILIKNFQDEAYFADNQEADILKFVGIGAPVRSELGEACIYETRGLLSFFQL